MPSDFENDDLRGLPDAAQALYSALTRDGAEWQARSAPTLERINARLEARVTQMQAAGDTGEATAEADAAPVSLTTRRLSLTPSDEHPALLRRDLAPRQPHWARRLGATLATIAVIAAFVGVFSLVALQRRGAGSPTSVPYGTNGTTGTSATAGAVDSPPGSWQGLSGLTSSASFSANDLPAIAPSDPQVVYETAAYGLQQGKPAIFRRTDDGGKTWQTLATPVQADHIGSAGIGVSPLNPQVAFLAIFDTSASDCPANRTQSMGEGAGVLCRLQYVTTNGGASWAAPSLPLANGVKAGVLAASATSGGAGAMQTMSIRAQGQRLYAAFLCVDFSCSRLVTSVDDGATWQFADLPLLAQGAANLCEYIPTPSGSTVYAVTTPTDCGWRAQSPRTLWRSDNAGASWVKVSLLSTPNTAGLLTTQDATLGTRLLYLDEPATASMATDKMGGSFPITTTSPGDVKVSVDGGATWQSAPTAGVASGQVANNGVGLLATLRDGSVVIETISSAGKPADMLDNFSGSSLYTWKPGESAWRLLATVPAEADNLVVVPAGGATGDTIYTTLVNRFGEGSGAGPVFTPDGSASANFGQSYLTYGSGSGVETGAGSGSGAASATPTYKTTFVVWRKSVSA